MVNLREKLPFFIVDVFAEKPFQGNQLAVVLNDGDLTSDLMLAIAREMNYSETAFLDPRIKTDRSFNLRIFTPEKEIPFAGHPLLGSAFILKHFILKNDSQEIKFSLAAGPISIFCSQEKTVDFFWFEHFSPHFGKTIDPHRMLKILQLELNDFDQKFPPQEVSTGIPFIIVPLASLNAVKSVTINRKEISRLPYYITSKEILVFCSQTVNPQNDLHVRVFVEYPGIPEDPATGSASGCLAAYLLKHNYLGRDNLNLNLEQGYEAGRPSLIKIKARKHCDSLHILTGGQVFLIAEGHLFFN